MPQETRAGEPKKTRSPAAFECVAVAMSNPVRCTRYNRGWAKTRGGRIRSRRVIAPRIIVKRPDRSGDGDHSAGERFDLGSASRAFRSTRSVTSAKETHVQNEKFEETDQEKAVEVGTAKATGQAGEEDSLSPSHRQRCVSRATVRLGPIIVTDYPDLGRIWGRSAQAPRPFLGGSQRRLSGRDSPPYASNFGRRCVRLRPAPRASRART